MRLIKLGVFLWLTLLLVNGYAVTRYGELICSQTGYTCYKVKSGDTWQSLFPNPDTRDLEMRLNRLNLNLRAGWIIAIPKNLANINYFDVSPFPLKVNPTGQKTVLVDLNQLAWGAYDEEGNLINWGPASGGQGWCSDVDKPCRTQTGIYQVISKQGYDCISSKFPEPYGGAAMPYCMHYTGPYALHGSFEVPGYNASHGCVRMFINDARWLNNNFADYNTKVIVKNYTPSLTENWQN